mgnify:CR=1 FL=1
MKYSDPETGMSCDVCVNNMLAVENTKLLHDYAQIDVRLRQLAFLVKHWAKCRQVNETYRGTLSSYAYVSFMHTLNNIVLEIMVFFLLGYCYMSPLSYHLFKVMSMYVASFHYL